MNIYIVVEGAVGEKKVYTEWIPLVNSTLSHAPTLNEVAENNFYIAIGGGYPNIFEVIEDGIEDVTTIYKNNYRLFDRFVVVIDSEENTLADKKNEITDFIDPILLQKNITFDYKVIVQHFCLEAWALGNKKITSNNIRIPELIKYKSIFDVATNDPEHLPPLPEQELNRAQFALKYLTILLNNKHRNHSYSKNNPDALLNKKYFEQVKKRYQETAHIGSFDAFLTAFI